MSTATAPPTVPSRPPAPPARMRPGHWVLLVAGVLLSLLGLGLTIGGALLLGADAAQRDGRYLNGEPQRIQSSGYALTTPSAVIDLGEVGVPTAAPLGDLATVQVRVTPVIPGQEVFVGIAEAADVAGYLDGVPHSTLADVTWQRSGPPSGPWTGPDPGPWSWAPRAGQDLEQTTGDRVPATPADQDFWATSVAGTGTQEVTFELQQGQWSLVVMNADASRPVWVEVQPGVRTAVLGPVGTGLLIGGPVSLVLGIPLLLAGAAGLGRDIDPRAPQRGRGPGAALAQAPGRGGEVDSVYPLWFTGFLDRRLSRGLWLVKWLLAIPHHIVLALLWFALIITTIAAGLAILFTGRYPRSWFAFSVGVLRWNWRVGFYAYSALGTDRYPPFTLASADYPANLEVAYPDRLSRGLVLVKWWLLAIPHLLILGILTGSAGAAGAGARWDDDGGWTTSSGWSISLMGLLVLVAAVILLFTARYPRGIFNLVVGLNRWIYRVFAYVLLLRDEYPPFRLDQGPTDPPAQTANASPEPHPEAGPETHDTAR